MEGDSLGFMTLPCLCEKWEDFWAELGDIRGLWGDLWCLARDFNMVSFLGERRNINIIQLLGDDFQRLQRS